jgi:hypothetical protein
MVIFFREKSTQQIILLYVLINVWFLIKTRLKYESMERIYATSLSVVTTTVLMHVPLY